MKMISTEEYEGLIAAAAERDRLLAMINRPELVDFPAAVLLEAAHQEVRWGTNEVKGKEPGDWFWLVGHLSTRALEHHKEANRLQERLALTNMAAEASGASADADGFAASQIAHHREKAVHHCITAAAVLAHWHADALGKATSMQPGHPPSIALVKEVAHG